MINRLKIMDLRMLPLAVLSMVMVLLAACGGNGRRTSPYVDVNTDFNHIYETIVTSADLSHAKGMIKKAYDEERIGEGQKKYLEAIVVYRAEARFDSVMEICQQALDASDTKNDKTLTCCIYALMTNSAVASENNAAMLQYASATETLAQELGRKDKEFEMKATVGYGMVLLGNSEEGLKMIDQALADLMKYDSWNCLNSYLIASKIKVVALHILNRPADVVDLCEKVIALLDKCIAHPEGIKDKPLAWEKDKESFAVMLKLYRTQMLAFLSYAHAEMGNRDLAMQSLEEFDQSEQSKSLDSQRMIVPALGELKLFDRMLAVYAKIDKEDGGDTITESYRDELKLKASAASAKGNRELERHYLRRALNLEDTLHEAQNMALMAHTLSVYKVQDEQMKAQDAKAAAKLMLVALVALATIVIFVVVYMFRLYKQKQVVALKNKALVSSIEKALEYKDRYEMAERALEDAENRACEAERNSEMMRVAIQRTAKGKEIALRDDNAGLDEELSAVAAKEAGNANDASSDNSEDASSLFEQIDRNIRDERLYLNPDFQRQTLVDMFHSDRNRVGRVIKDFSGFSNLSAYINNYRLEYAYRLLRDLDSKQTIDSIAKASGFSTVRTFQRLFKERYGMTPAEFRESYPGLRTNE